MDDGDEGEKAACEQLWHCAAPTVLCSAIDSPGEEEAVFDSHVRRDRRWPWRMSTQRLLVGCGDQVEGGEAYAGGDCGDGAAEGIGS